MIPWFEQSDTSTSSSTNGVHNGVLFPQSGDNFVSKKKRRKTQVFEKLVWKQHIHLVLLVAQKLLLSFKQSQ